MEDKTTQLDSVEASLVELWERMVRTIGIHTVNVLFDRAIWQSSQKHPELALIEHSDNGISFQALNKALADRPAQGIATAFSDLTTELLMILARILGKEMAERLAAELQGKAGPVSAKKPPVRGGKRGIEGTR